MTTSQQQMELVALEMTVVHKGPLFPPGLFQQTEGLGIKQGGRAGEGIKRNTAKKRHLGKASTSSLQEALAYFHRPLKLDKKHEDAHKA